MRILLTSDPILPVPPVGYGGIERIIDALVRELRRRGHQVGLLALGTSTCAADARFAWPVPKVRGAWANVRNALTLRRAVRSFVPDVVHSFSRLGYLMPILRSTVPKIMSYQRHPGPRQIGLAQRWARRDTLRFTGCSDYLCALGRTGGGRWTAIPNFVDLARIPFSAQVEMTAPLVFLSRVESIKGAHLAIEIARASGRPLIIAGNHASEGPEADYWRRRIAPALDGRRVRYVGEVDDIAKYQLLGHAAALVVPIQWDEPFGIVFIEALAAGTPVITCARGAAPEIIVPGITGFFIRDAADGAAAVQQLAALDRRACRARVEQQFSLERCAQRYLDLYAEAVTSAG